MHEMPYTQAILEQALESAGGRKITQIRLRVGLLSAIVPESVETFFDYLSQGTIAEDATLIFETEPLLLICKNCQANVTIKADANLSPRQSLAAAYQAGCNCETTDYSITAGLGFDMTGIEVE